MVIDGAGAIVTGGSSGLGLATAELLSEAGASVVIADVDHEAGAAAAERLGCRFVRTDVADEESVGAAIRTTVEGGVPLRIVVSCAGVGWAQRLIARDGLTHPLRGFEKCYRVNQLGTFNLLRIGAAAMRTSPPGADGERGVIVNCASAAAVDGHGGQVAYAASKGAVVAMTVPAARDLKPFGIRVCTIAPGTFDTKMFRSMTEERMQDLVNAQVFPRRVGDPREFGKLVCSIAENSYLNAATLRLDAGLRLV
jgi:NAD(P)-dependent dehydrogenase (short-subunit alcohol dehydrogenase family)